MDFDGMDIRRNRKPEKNEIIAEKFERKMHL